MTYIMETRDLGKRYGHRWALRGCHLHVPASSVTGLVGLNGAGKTTLLHLAAGLIEPGAGSIQVLGETPSQTSTSFLARIGFVAQGHPLYRSFSVKEMLLMGRKLNPQWNEELARTSLQRLKIPLNSTVGKLSGGQQTQVALVLALAKQPQLLLLDEPFANVDPLARREFLKIMLETAATTEMTVLLSSHLIADMEIICDYLIILSDGHVQIEGNIESLLASHKRLTGRSEQSEPLSSGTHTVLQASRTGRQSSLLVRTQEAIHEPSWQVRDISLEEMILAYLASPANNIQEQPRSEQEVLQ